MDDLIVRWVVGRRTGKVDPEDKLQREEVLAVIETHHMTMDGVLRRLRTHMLEDDVVALTVQIGENDHVSDETRDELRSHQ